MKAIRIVMALCAFCLGRQSQAEVAMTATPSKAGNVVASVSLAFSGIPVGGEYALFIAYGAKDAGDDIRLWEKYVKIADVTTGTASFEYAEMPDGWGFKYHAIRFFLFDKNAAKPFDRALEYVEATGAQYVLTDFTPNGASVVEADIETAADNSSWETIFCARASNGSNPFVLLKQGGVFRFDYFSHNNSTALWAGHTADRQRVRLSAGGLCIDGRLQDGPVDAVATAAGGPLALFALRTSSGFGAYGKARLYGLRVWADASEGAALSLDLVPCATNGVACLYDRVGGKFYGPAGDALAASSSDAFYFTDSAAAQTEAVADVAGSLSIAAVLNADGTADVSFPALPGPCKLFAVYADHDCGGDVRGWEKSVFVADLPAGATAFSSWQLPEGWGTACHYLRFFLVDMSKAPCDRQYDFIRGQGQQYIVLSDVTPNGRSSIVADVTVDSADNHGIWSARTSGNNNLLIFYGGSKTLRWDYQVTHDNLACSLGRHVLSADANVLSCDGDPLFTAATTNKNDFGTPLVLFALNSGATVSTYGKFKLHSFKIWRNRAVSGSQGYGKAVWRDLVPCEKDGAAGLYDKVTGDFYGNAGSGVFAVGDEIICGDGLQVGSSGPCFAASGRAMSVTKNYTGGLLSSVRLDFAAAESPLAYHLYAAFDETDKGEDIDGWADVRYLDPIAAADSSYTYTFPAWWGRTSQTVRFFLMADAPATSPMPYDKRLEYIQGANAAYIQTSFHPTGKSRVLMDCRTMVADNNTAFSIRNATGSFLAILQSDLCVRYDLQLSGSKYTAAHPLGRYMLMFDGSGAFVDGAREISATSGREWPDVDWQNSGSALSIFALQTAGAVSTSSKGRYQLYSFKAWRDVKSAPGTLGLDLVPCEKDGRPGVYDRVSGEFMASAVSDDFVAGREIPLAPTTAAVTRAMGFRPAGLRLFFR